MDLIERGVPVYPEDVEVLVVWAEAVIARLKGATNDQKPH